MTTGPTTQLESGRRVLVLDRDGQLDTALAAALRPESVEIEAAAHGFEALRALLRNPVDACIVALGAPDHNELVFIEQAVQLWPRLPVVVVVAAADEAGAEAVSRLRVGEPLRDVTDVAAVVQRLRQCLRQRDTDTPTAMVRLEDVQEQMRALRRLTERAVAAASPTRALQTLRGGLGRLFSCEAVASLVLDDADAAVLSVSLFQPVSPAFVEETRRRIVRHFEALSGRSIGRVELDLHGEEERCVAAGVETVASVISVPVFDRHRIQEVLSIASSRPAAELRVDISALYHAADHFAMVFTTLARMRQLAIRDPLTGLYNRLYIEEELEHAWNQQTRYQQAFDVILLDIDHFKTVNDTFGHAVGDDVLAEFAQVLARGVRQADIVGRWGGEEFIVLLAGPGHADGMTVAGRLLAEVRNHVFCAATSPLRLSVSIGVASSATGHGADASVDQVLRQADHALYRAKSGGRNQARAWAAPSETPAAGTDPRGRPANPTVLAADATRISKGTVLVVDDEPAVASVLQRILAKEGYEVFTAGTADKALALLRERPGAVDVLLSDICMPDTSGLELLPQVRGIDESVIMVMMTANPSLDNAVASLRHGAYDFIEKPFVQDHLFGVLRRAVAYRRVLVENRRYQVFLEDMVRQKSRQLSQSLDEVKNAYRFTLEALAAMLDAREHESAIHSQRVRDLTLILARHMNVSAEDLEAIGHGALLHDIGKIAIPDSVLLKAATLTAEETTVMRTHAEVGYTILRSSPWLQKTAEIVYSHHERYDGTGYPRGLKGESIYLGARIFSVVDAFDAMVHKRVYREAFTPEYAFAEIVAKSGSQFDPQVVTAFLACREKVLAHLAAIAETPAATPGAITAA